MASKIKNPRGDGYIVSYRDRKRVGHTKTILKDADAEEFRDEARAVERLVKQKIRFRVAAKDFIDHLALKGDDVSTIEKLQRAIDTHVNPVLGRRFVHRMDNEDLRELLDILVQKVSEEYATDLVRVARRILKGALVNQHTTFNAERVLLTVRSNAANSGLPGTEHLRAIKAPGAVSPDDLPSVDEIRIMLSGSTGVGRILICLGLLAGLRISEMLGLQLKHLKFDANRIEIRRIRRRRKRARSSVYAAPRQRKEKKPTKSEAGERDVEMDPFLRAVLESFVKELPDDPERPLLESSVKPGQPISPTAALHHLQANQARLGVGQMQGGRVRPYGFHDLRDACVSLWLHVGYDIFDIADWIGHADVVTTIRYYARLLRQEDEAREEAQLAA